MTRCETPVVGPWPGGSSVAPNRLMYSANSGCSALAANVCEVLGSLSRSSATQVAGRIRLKALVTATRIARVSRCTSASWLTTSLTIRSPAPRLVSLLRANRWVTSANVATTRVTSSAGPSRGTASIWTQTSEPSGRWTRARTPRTGCMLLAAAVTGWTDIGPSADSRTSQSASSANDPISWRRVRPRISNAASFASATCPFGS